MINPQVANSLVNQNVSFTIKPKADGIKTQGTAYLAQVKPLGKDAMLTLNNFDAKLISMPKEDAFPAARLANIEGLEDIGELKVASYSLRLSNLTALEQLR